VSDGAGAGELAFERLTGEGEELAEIAPSGSAQSRPVLPDVFELVVDLDDASEQLHLLSEEPMRRLIEMIAGAQADGIVRAGDPHELAVVVFASVHGVATLATDDLLDGVPWERAAESTIDFAWRGIAARPIGTGPGEQD
jgi:AcrR family transcriptional regulator